jgi:hypothetical protein
MDFKESIPPAYVASEPVFVNGKGAQESIPRNQFAGLCSQAGRYGCCTGPPSWKSIPGILKRFTYTGSVVILLSHHFVTRQPKPRRLSGLNIL